MIRRIVLGIATAACALYLGDYVSVRYGIPGHRPQFGTVLVRRSYAIPQKNGRLQYTFDPPESQPCVNSLFPHLDSTPCWYLRRHSQKRIDF